MRERRKRDWLLPRPPLVPCRTISEPEPLGPAWELASSRRTERTVVLDADNEDWDDRLERLAAERAALEADPLAALTRAIERDPTNPAPWTRRGIVRARAGRLAEALADYSRALALDEDYLPARANRASAHFHLGEHEAAARDATRVIDREPELPLPWLVRGLARARLRQARPAEDDLLRHLELAPYSKHVYLIRSVLREVADWDERAPLPARRRSATPFCPPLVTARAG